MFAKRTFSINFMQYKKVAMLLSAVLIVLSLALLFLRGLNLGIDFSGGVLVQVELSQPLPVGELREVLRDEGFSGSTIQAYGDKGVIIRVAADTDETQLQVLEVLKGKDAELELLRLEKVGPVVGKQLRQEAIIATFIALAGILAYITFRFRFRFALVSVVALMHDTIITLGIFSLLGREISLPFVAAILTLVGYSLNDTIVVLDRVRENWKDARPLGLDAMLNKSVNQTFSRTINTSLTTFLPVCALFLFGGPVIANFSLALLVGILVGTYSSIYVAAALLSEWYSRYPAKS